jgi:hypothetical protein
MSDLPARHLDRDELIRRLQEEIADSEARADDRVGQEQRWEESQEASGDEEEARHD